MAIKGAPLKIGYVPEHFSTPLYFAQKYFGLDAELIPFPAGTGHMITSLRSGEIDAALGLTEGWVAGLGKSDVEGDGGYRIVGTYVETPLCWAISTGANRSLNGIPDLKNGKIGVSRIGSGSYVMGFVLADEQGWLDESQSSDGPFDVVPLETFEKLRKGVNDGTADFFMWEHFTSKRYYDSGEIKKIGEIYTPWSSWKIVASTTVLKNSEDKRLDDLFEKLDKGIKYFQENQGEAVKYISTSLDYSEEDAKEWLKTVRFASSTKKVDLAVIQKTVATLQKAKVLGHHGMSPEQMIAK
ncbi:hypothetical protein DSL72_000568 [Monilinia vaccinii-corymbosi]|uniref:Ca3427-like PBP 2 domain-containing protein n=1 Tax=Monilinia vaccinii-corymbosi TaxID=61207 RepID=A0A8A3PAC9_9HELO|nr:hypothetical protein DSL72_000568 [Monilinia vaccinii-corymbosi]